MKHESLIQEYAQALFELAKEKNSVEQNTAELETFEKSLEINPKYKKFFSSPIIPFEKKTELLDIFFSKKSALPLNFIKILISKKRLALLAGICQQLQKLIQEQNNILSIECSSAYPLNETEKKLLTKYLSEYTGKKAIFSFQVFPQLLAGIELKYKDKIFSLNMVNQIQQLRHTLEV